ncbi:MAG TPA: M23 family metallopeptidase, partial [Pirellulaceae bacterium]|nr:M23 family metallopeptidase [Pirellulaceae bacterium]
MTTSNLGRKLKAWAISGSLAAALAADAAGQEGRGVLIDNPVPQGHGWVNPRRTEVGQGDGRFGPVRTRRDASGNLTVRNHNGLDLSAPVGAPVRSPVSGIVIRSVPNWRGENANGNEVRVLGEDGREYWFFHLSGRNQPAIGERIEAGASIGEVGRTAIPAGAASHLHFEVRENGRPLPLESIGGDSRQGLFNYVLSQPQTTREEVEMIRSYLGEDRNYTPHPSGDPNAEHAAEPSLFDQVIDFLIPSAHGQSRPEGQGQAGQTLSADESA